MDKGKRQLRKLKRQLKRVGGKRRRQQLKHDLAANPAEAAHSATDFGNASSATLNGLDEDATRRRN